MILSYVGGRTFIINNHTDPLCIDDNNLPQIQQKQRSGRHDPGHRNMYSKDHYLRNLYTFDYLKNRIQFFELHLISHLSIRPQYSPNFLTLRYTENLEHRGTFDRQQRLLGEFSQL